MRKPFIAGNWKMHKTVKEAVELAGSLKEGLKAENKKVMIAPPFTALSAVNEVIHGSNILLGAQNMGPAEEGAHTGEISVKMLKDVGVSVVILGHSERRHVYNEPDTLINKKVKLALLNKMEVILCVGETLKEREDGIAENVVENQLISGLEGVQDKQLAGITVAYEPVWAIGTGKTAMPSDADKMHAFIRKIIEKRFSKKSADNLIVQYGGSVKPGNIKELMRMDNIDGALVGGAALKRETFIPIVRFDKE
ncbi:MAG: triose-phosphate isomerase [Spirochaetes bacterium]|nr:MAG: triose-phosphate isomerase [Spirochaetota bacterium]